MSYDPDWKMRYVELKGWDNMSEGEKYLVTHTCSSSAMGMGMKSMQEELKRMCQSTNCHNPPRQDTHNTL